MADVEFNGSQGIVPDFAMEDTQQKILAELKKAFNLDKSGEKAAKDALNAENKNSKMQLDAFKKLSKDIQDSMDGKGSFMGQLGDVAGKTAGAFSGLLGPVAKVTGAVTAVGLALGSLALDITRGLGDELKGAGLVETGAAFGELGKELPTLIPKFQTMGLSLGAAADAVQNFRAAMTQLGEGGGSAVASVVKQFQQMTNSGAKFGMTIQENIEYLADEIEYRQRMGYIERGREQEQAALALESLESQIKASKLLGKSVEEIRTGVRDLFSTSQAQAFYANMGAVNKNIIENMFNTLDGAGISNSLQNSIMSMINDPNFLQSPEAQELFADIGIIGGEAADQVKDSMETLRRAMLNKEDTEGIRKAARAFEEDMLEFVSGIKDIEDPDQRILRMYNRQGILDMIAAQNTATIALKNFRDMVDDPSLARSIQLSTEFDNQIEQIKAVLGSIETTLSAAFAPTLEHFVGLLGKASDENSPLGKFSIDVERISARFIVAMNKLLGVEEDAAKEGEQGKDGLTFLLESLSGAIEGALEAILGLTEDWQKISQSTGGDFLETLKIFMIDSVLKPLGDALVDAVAYMFENIDIIDVLLGNSDGKSIREAQEQFAQGNAMIDADMKARGVTEEDERSVRLRSQNKKRAVDTVLDRADDRDYGANKTLEMLKKAGFLKDGIEQNLTSEQLAKVFNTPQDLVNAGVSGYIDKETFDALKSVLEKQYKEDGDRLFGSNRNQAKIEALLGAEYVAPDPDPMSQVNDQQVNERIIHAEVQRLIKTLDQNSLQNLTPEELDSKIVKLANSALDNIDHVIIKSVDDVNTEEATSQDGTKTSEVKKVTSEDSSGGGQSREEFLQLIMKGFQDSLGPKLDEIAKNTKSGAKASQATASNTQ